MNANNAALDLVPGIKRGTYRDNDARREIADSALKAKRPQVLSRYRMTCAGCGYQAKDPVHLDVHHLDDDHHNNDDENLIAACHTCHPYQHIGEAAARLDCWAETLGKKTLLAFVPELSRRDVSLLQRAIGAVLASADASAEAKADARELAQLLTERGDITRDVYGTFEAASFAAAMAAMSDEAYKYRADAMQGLALVFSPRTQEKLGAEMLKDYPSTPVSIWPTLAQETLQAYGGSSVQGEETRLGARR